MRLGLTLIAMISVGCGIDTAAPDPGNDNGVGAGGMPIGDPGPSDPGEGTGPVTDVAGHITANTTWSNTIHATDLVTVNAGVTVTVAAGTTVDLSTGLSVLGTLVLQGSRNSKVVFRPAGSTGF